ncbi:MAG: hypothetical protein PF689_00370, partial [Deltaproteobacteria bacterium]|nr:hypothetical protein [Deltaproteobacteria bacterium]
MCIEQSGFKSILCEDELVVEDIKYSNTINLLTSVETILYGGEIHLWIPKKLNIFRGYVDKPDIWSFFLGEDERDFLVQQTATSPEINNIAMTTNSDIIGGSFYEENSEGAFFINCRKHEGEIKFTLDKISDYS